MERVHLEDAGVARICNTRWISIRYYGTITSRDRCSWVLFLGLISALTREKGPVSLSRSRKRRRRRCGKGKESKAKKGKEKKASLYLLRGVAAAVDDPHSTLLHGSASWVNPLTRRHVHPVRIVEKMRDTLSRLVTSHRTVFLGFLYAFNRVDGCSFSPLRSRRFWFKRTKRIFTFSFVFCFSLDDFHPWFTTFRVQLFFIYLRKSRERRFLVQIMITFSYDLVNLILFFIVFIIRVKVA